MTVEDEVGPRMSNDGSAVESEEEIDLDEFYKEYIRPGRESATVVVEGRSPHHIFAERDRKGPTRFGGPSQKLIRLRRARFLPLMDSDQRGLGKDGLRAFRSTSLQVGGHVTGAKQPKAPAAGNDHDAVRGAPAGKVRLSRADKNR